MNLIMPATSSGSSSEHPRFGYYCPICKATRYCLFCCWRSTKFYSFSTHRGSDYGKEPGDYERRRKRKERRRKIRAEIAADKEKFEKLERLLEEAEKIEGKEKIEWKEGGESEDEQTPNAETKKERILEVNNLHIHITRRT